MRYFHRLAVFHAAISKADSLTSDSCSNEWSMGCLRSLDLFVDKIAKVDDGSSDILELNVPAD